MPIQPDTLRKIADTSPFPEGRYATLGATGAIERWEDAGMIQNLVRRAFTEEKALAIVGDSRNPDRELERTFYRGKEALYLKADLNGRVDSTRIAAAAMARIRRDDPESAQEYQDVLNDRGAQGLFAYIGAEVRRQDLEQLATPRTQGLASVEEGLARRSRGRVM